MTSGILLCKCFLVLLPREQAPTKFHFQKYNECNYVRQHQRRISACRIFCLSRISCATAIHARNRLKLCIRREDVRPATLCHVYCWNTETLYGIVRQLSLTYADWSLDVLTVLVPGWLRAYTEYYYCTTVINAVSAITRLISCLREKSHRSDGDFLVGWSRACLLAAASKCPKNDSRCRSMFPKDATYPSASFLNFGVTVLLWVSVVYFSPWTNI